MPSPRRGHRTSRRLDGLVPLVAVARVSAILCVSVVLACAPRLAKNSEPAPGASAPSDVAPKEVPKVERRAQDSVEPASEHEEPADNAPVAPPSVRPEAIPALPKALTTALGRAGRRKLEVAASVCAAAVKHAAGGALQVGCRACPPFEREGLPDGQIVVDPDESEFFELEALYPGSFTRANADEAAAVFGNCGSHAENFGGTLLVERAGAHWLSKSYRNGFHPARCETFERPDRRALLVCLWETDHQSNAHFLLDNYDFALGDDDHVEAGWTNLLTVDDDAIARCFDDPADEGEVSAGRIDSFRLDRSTSPATLRVAIHVAHRRKTAAYRARCALLLREMAKENGGRRVDVTQPLAPAPRSLSFVFRDGNFVPDARTSALLPPPAQPSE